MKEVRLMTRGTLKAVAVSDGHVLVHGRHTRSVTLGAGTGGEEPRSLALRREVQTVAADVSAEALPAAHQAMASSRP